MTASRVRRGVTSTRRWTVVLVVVACVGSLALSVVPAGAQSLSNGVGIKVTPTDVRPQNLEADFDLTWYTRVGPYPSTTAGSPAIGLPALDYGDGSTVPYTTLVLASSGGGPGGSNTYRNLASFTHTYPSAGSYTVRAGSFCTLCVRSQYVYFPAGSPVPSTFTGSIDYVPTTVVGNLAAKYSGSNTFYLSGLSTSVHYRYTYYAGISNTAQVVLQQAEAIPAASPWGLAILSGLLLLAGVAILRLT